MLLSDQNITCVLLVESCTVGCWLLLLLLLPPRFPTMYTHISHLYQHISDVPTIFPLFPDIDHYSLWQSNMANGQLPECVALAGLMHGSAETTAFAVAWESALRQGYPHFEQFSPDPGAYQESCTTR